MDGLEAVEINLSTLVQENNTFRFDSEYLKKEYLKNEKIVRRFKNGFIQLRDEIKSMAGGATPLGADYPDTGTLFLRVQNIMQNYITDDDTVFINPQDDKTLLRSRLKENDVLLTITGVSYGKSATVTKEYIDSNINQHSVKITLRGNRIKPYFLSTFLNSRYGKLQSDKNITGVTRPALDYEAIRQFTIPLTEVGLQNMTEDVVRRAHQNLERSRLFYQEAEDILLEHLGLKDWQPSEEGVSVKSSSEAFWAERLDPEFYQPKFDELESIITAKENVQPLGEFLVVNARGKQPSYEDDGVLVVNSKHVRTGKVIITDNRRATLEKGALTIRKGDVLINGTGVGTIGRCAPYLHEEIALPDNHVTVLRTEELDPVYLSVYLNSPAGQLQVDKHYKGSSGQIEVYPDQITSSARG